MALSDINQQQKSGRFVPKWLKDNESTPRGEDNQTITEKSYKAEKSVI